MCYGYWASGGIALHCTRHTFVATRAYVCRSCAARQCCSFPTARLRALLAQSTATKVTLLHSSFALRVLVLDFIPFRSKKSEKRLDRYTSPQICAPHSCYLSLQQHLERGVGVGSCISVTTSVFAVFYAHSESPMALTEPRSISLFSHVNSVLCGQHLLAIAPCTTLWPPGTTTHAS